MLHTVLVASVISLCVIAEASAQTSPAQFTDFSGLVGIKTVSVIDDSGFEFRGRLITFTPDSLKVSVNGQDVAFERKDVAALFERGNSLKKGMIVGALTGPVLLVASAAAGDQSVASGEGAAAAVIFSALGFGIGTAVDAMIPGKRLIYRKAGSDIGYPKKRGMIIGLATGMTTGFAIGASKDDCDHTPPEGYPQIIDCYADEKIANGLKVAAVSAIAGAGLGTVIDRTIGKRHQNIAISPSFARGGAGMITTFSW